MTQSKAESKEPTAPLKLMSIPLSMTENQIKEFGPITARIGEELGRDLHVLDHDWKLVSRWPSRGKPVFAAEAKIKTLSGRRVRIQLHRFACGLHQARKDAPKVYVIPRDGDALHCEWTNLHQMTHEEWEERKHRSAGKLTDEQQTWLDAKRKETGLGIWTIFGQFIDRELLSDPFAD